MNNLMNTQRYRKDYYITERSKLTKKKTQKTPKPPCRFVLLKRINLHLELFIGNPTRAAAPPPRAVSTIFILILLGVIQASREAAAAQRTWQRAPLQVQILLCENTSHRKRSKDFHLYTGDGGDKVKDLLFSISYPLLVYSSAQTAKDESKCEGKQEDSSGAANQHREKTGTPLLMLSSPSPSPDRLSSADVHALSIPDRHPGRIW